MKQSLVLSIFMLNLVASLAFAATSMTPTLPPHMSGFGIFTFKSTVPAAVDKVQAIAYAKDIKSKGFSYVMIKSHDGNSWGTRVAGQG